MSRTTPQETDSPSGLLHTCPSHTLPYLAAAMDEASDSDDHADEGKGYMIPKKVGHTGTTGARPSSTVAFPSKDILNGEKGKRRGMEPTGCPDINRSLLDEQARKNEGRRAIIDQINFLREGLTYEEMCSAARTAPIGSENSVEVATI